MPRKLTTPRDSRPREQVVLDSVRTGILSIDELGRIWRHGVRDCMQNVIPCERRRAETLDMFGYYDIRLWVHSHDYSSAAHRVVWVYFNGLIPDKMTINHKNGIKTDNRIENMEVLSIGDNGRHGFAIGLCNIYGERNWRSKLTDAETVEMRTAYAAGGVLCSELSEKYGVNESTVARIINGTRRAKIGGPISKDNRGRNR
jgi:hypothetical protein